MKGYSTIKVKSESAGLIQRYFLFERDANLLKSRKHWSQSGLWKEAWQRITMRLWAKGKVRELGFDP
jgi:hypothetical protein